MGKELNDKSTEVMQSDSNSIEVNNHSTVDLKQEIMQSKDDKKKDTEHSISKTNKNSSKTTENENKNANNVIQDESKFNTVSANDSSTFNTQVMPEDLQNGTASKKQEISKLNNESDTKGESLKEIIEEDTPTDALN